MRIEHRLVAGCEAPPTSPASFVKSTATVVTTCTFPPKSSPSRRSSSSESPLPHSQTPPASPRPPLPANPRSFRIPRVADRIRRHRYPLLQLQPIHLHHMPIPRHPHLPLVRLHHQFRPPAMRPTRITGFFMPDSSTRLICSNTLSCLAMRSDSHSASSRRSRRPAAGTLRRAARRPAARADSRSPTTPRSAAVAPVRRLRDSMPSGPRTPAAARPCVTASSPGARRSCRWIACSNVNMHALAGTTNEQGAGPGRRQDRRADFRPAGRIRRLPGADSPTSTRPPRPAFARAHASADCPAGAARCRRCGGAALASARRIRCRRWSPACPITAMPLVAAAARDGRHALFRPDRGRGGHAARQRAGAECRRRIRTAVRPGAGIHQHRRWRADPALRQLAQRAAAGRRAAAASAQCAEILAHLVHRRTHQRVRQPVRGHRRWPAVEVRPLEGLEEIEIDGTLYEAFNTSGGLGSWRRASAAAARAWITRPSATRDTASRCDC